jgi:hypothetical protein
MCGPAFVQLPRAGGEELLACRAAVLSRMNSAHKKLCSVPSRSPCQGRSDLSLHCPSVPDAQLQVCMVQCLLAPAWAAAQHDAH